MPLKIRERAVSFGINFVKGLRLNLSFSNYVKLLFSSIVVWVFLIPFYWFLMQGFEFGPNVTILETIPYFSMLVVSAAVPTPGMAGSFDIVSREALTSSIYNAHINEAVAYTVLAHFLILMVMVIPGIIAFWMKGVNIQTIRKLKSQTQPGNGSPANNN